MLASKNDMLYYCYENVDVCCDNCHAMPILWRMYAKSEVSDMPDHIYIPMYDPKVKKNLERIMNHQHFNLQAV
jgi:hypothetical protein